MPTKQAERGSSLSGSVQSAIIGLLATLIATGIISTVSLYTRVATLTEDVQRTEAQLQKHLEHAVDKDDYLRRDNEIRNAINSMATKDDLRELRDVLLDKIDGHGGRGASNLR